MKKVFKKRLEEKGKVRVNIKNKEMEYGAKVNGNFLLLYDPNADMNDVLTTFDGYTSGGVNAGTSAKDTTNTPTSDGAYGNAKTNDPNAGNTTSGNQNGDVNNNGKTNANNTNGTNAAGQNEN